MLFFIRYRDKEYRVRVESRQEQLHVSLDKGPDEPVDLFFLGNDCTFIHKNQVFEANIVGKKNDYTVWRPEGALQFAVESEYRRIVGLLRGQEVEQEGNVYAKMPGKIVKVVVKNGSKVEKGDSVMVMEAMKMENEIRSTLTGIVTNVCVSEGQAVETGTLLLELKPDEGE